MDTLPWGHFSVCQKFLALPAEKHLTSYTEAEGKSTDAFAVLEHDSDENKLDLCVTLLAGSIPMIPLDNRLCVR